MASYPPPITILFSASSVETLNVIASKVLSEPSPTLSITSIVVSCITLNSAVAPARLRTVRISLVRLAVRVECLCLPHSLPRSRYNTPIFMT